MLAFSPEILNDLSQRDKYVIPVVEIYTRDTEDITSIAAPALAIARWSNTCFDWITDEGTHSYEAKVLDFPSVKSYLGEEINNAEVVVSNAERGLGSTARFVLNNQIKGCWMVIRLIFPRLRNQSRVVFWGKCDRPGGINSEEIEITARQELGNFGQEIPFRDYGVQCPLDFARPGGSCLGDQTLQEKSLAYQQAVADYGTGGCNKRFTTCTFLGNTRYFQGQQVVAVSGQFSYVTVEEVVKRVLFWTKRKKVRKIKSDSWSSVNQSEGGETIPLAFGRCQLQGQPFTWADRGTQVRALQGFCEGKISAFNFIRSRTEGINIIQTIEHLGDWGGVGTQTPDIMFEGHSGFNSRLAYLEVATDGSSPTQVDDAPIVTAVIRGLELPVPNVDGQYTMLEWTNNPVHVLRFVLTDKRFGKIPEYRMDDEEGLITAGDCETIVEDRTNDEAIILPSNEFYNYNTGYRRYRSASRYSAYKESFDRLGLFNPLQDMEFPEFEHPEIRWFNPFQPYTLPPQNVILRQKYTFNGALQEKTELLDFINERILPTFKGFINYSPNGKIQIKNRRKADNGYVRMPTRAGATRVAISNVQPWMRDRRGFIVVGVSLEEAEVREVTTFSYSTACNNMVLTATSTGGISVITSGILSNGSEAHPSMGFITLGGSVSVGNTVEVTLDSGDNEFKISYSADGIEDLAGFARMLTQHLNCNPQFHNYLTAYILESDPHTINIRCETGYLWLDEPLEFDHQEGEEILRVEHVFENCGELTANTSARFDNIIEGSFQWNDEVSEEYNAVTAKYTSAVDDFHLANLLPRAAWDTIDLEGELNKKELDLTFVDNYWQAAYLTKGEAIDLIDGNINFTFETNILAAQLEFGDVVAVRHDSGDGALNYVPAWVTSLEFDLNSFKVKIGLKLYLSAAFDLHVAPIDSLLTTTLNAEDLPEVLPPTIGSSGGLGGGTEPVYPRASHDYYAQFQRAVYSPSGQDLV